MCLQTAPLEALALSHQERQLWGRVTQAATGKKRVHAPGHSNSSALIQGLADLESSVFRTWGEAWQVSANLSRAFSQFFWVLVLVREASSTERAALAPRPDWDFLIFSWICEGREDTGRKKTQPKRQNLIQLHFLQNILYRFQFTVFVCSIHKSTCFKQDKRYIYLSNVRRPITEKQNPRRSYRVFHSSAIFPQALALLPAHLFQHLPSFVHLADLPARHGTRQDVHANVRGSSSPKRNHRRVQLKRNTALTHP